MTPALFVALLLGGLSLAATTLHVGGFTRDGRFGGPSEVVEALRRQAPDVAITAVHLSDDRRAALVQAADGRWLVTFLGLRPFARKLHADDGRPTPTGVHYALGFDVPSVDIVAAHPHTAWLAAAGGE